MRRLAEGQESNREIAAQCRVSDFLVRTLRNEQSAIKSHSNIQTKPEREPQNFEAIVAERVKAVQAEAERRFAEAQRFWPDTKIFRVSFSFQPSRAGEESVANRYTESFLFSQQVGE